MRGVVKGTISSNLTVTTRRELMFEETEEGGGDDARSIDAVLPES